MRNAILGAAALAALVGCSAQNPAAGTSARSILAEVEGPAIEQAAQAAPQAAPVAQQAAPVMEQKVPQVEAPQIPVQEPVVVQQGLTACYVPTIYGGLIY